MSISNKAHYIIPYTPQEHVDTQYNDIIYIIDIIIYYNYIMKNNVDI